MKTIRIRPATEADLPIAYEVQREASQAAGMQIGNVVGMAGDSIPAKFRHELLHGRFLVAEVDSTIEGFGAVFQRMDVAFLATFYVRPGSQNARQRIGQQLFERLFENLGPIRCVVSSHVHRALAIYARNGLLPRWPLLMLKGDAEHLAFPECRRMKVIPANPEDSELIEWDAVIAKRGARTEDQRFWLDDYKAIPYWLQVDGKRVGYGYIQQLHASSDAPWNPDSVMIGPVGVQNVSMAGSAVIALATLGSRMAGSVQVDVPGEHPALRPLLESSFRITYQATFCSNSTDDIFDPQRYIPGDTITF